MCLVQVHAKTFPYPIKGRTFYLGNYNGQLCYIILSKNNDSVGPPTIFSDEIPNATGIVTVRGNPAGFYRIGAVESSILVGGQFARKTVRLMPCNASSWSTARPLFFRALGAQGAWTQRNGSPHLISMASQEVDENDMFANCFDARAINEFRNAPPITADLIADNSDVCAFFSAKRYRTTSATGPVWTYALNLKKPYLLQSVNHQVTGKNCFRCGHKSHLPKLALPKRSLRVRQRICNKVHSTVNAMAR